MKDKIYNQFDHDVLHKVLCQVLSPLSYRAKWGVRSPRFSQKIHLTISHKIDNQINLIKL